MTTRRGKKVQEALRDERFTKSVVRVKLSPARCRLRSCFRRRWYGRSHAVHHQHRSRPKLRNSLRHQRPEQLRRGVDGARFPRRRDPHQTRVESGANANAPAKPRHPFLSRCSAEPRKVSIGIRGQQGPINSPSILNARYNFVQFWWAREGPCSRNGSTNSSATTCARSAPTPMRYKTRWRMPAVDRPRVLPEPWPSTRLARAAGPGHRANARRARDKRSPARSGEHRGSRRGRTGA